MRGRRWGSFPDRSPGIRRPDPEKTDHEECGECDSDALLQLGIHVGSNRDRPDDCRKYQHRDGEAEHLADRPHRRDHTRGEAEVLHFHGTHDGVGVRGGEEAVPEPEDDHARNNDPDGCRRREQHQDAESKRGACHARGCENTRLRPVREVAGGRRDDHLDYRLGHEDQPRGLGIDPPVVLEVQAEQEPHGKDDRVVDERGEVREEEERALPEECDLDHRCRHPLLPPDEDREEGEAECHPEDAGRGGHQGEAVHAAKEHPAIEGCAGKVEAPFTRLCPLAGEIEQGEYNHEDRKGDVEEEDAGPADVLGEDAANEGPQREAGVHGCRDDPDGPAALPGREDRGDDGNRGGEDHGAPESLDHPGSNDNGPGPRKGGKERSQGEQEISQDEEPFPPVEVGEPAERDDADGGREQVGRGDPSQRHGIDVKRRADGRERNVERGDRVGDEEGCEGRDSKEYPLVPVPHHGRRVRR